MSQPVEVDSWELRVTGSSIASIGAALAQLVPADTAGPDDGWPAAAALRGAAHEWHAALRGLAGDVRDAGDKVADAAESYRLSDELARARAYGYPTS